MYLGTQAGDLAIKGRQGARGCKGKSTCNFSCLKHTAMKAVSSSLSNDSCYSRQPVPYATRQQHRPCALVSLQHALHAARQVGQQRGRQRGQGASLLVPCCPRCRGRWVQVHGGSCTAGCAASHCGECQLQAAQGGGACLHRTRQGLSSEPCLYLYDPKAVLCCHSHADTNAHC